MKICARIFKIKFHFYQNSKDKKLEKVNSA